jgi:hypothetical protein
MKKLTLTIAIILGMTLTTFADGGLFQRGYNAKNGFSGYSVYFNSREGNNLSEDPIYPLLPEHGQSDNQAAPLGSGIVALMGLGTAYMVAKKRKEE